MERSESHDSLVYDRAQPEQPARTYAAYARSHLIAGLIGLVIGLCCAIATLTARIPNNRRTWGVYFGNGSVPRLYDTLPVPVGHVAPALLLVTAARCIVAACILRGTTTGNKPQKPGCFLASLAPGSKRLAADAAAQRCVYLLRCAEMAVTEPMLMALLGVVGGVGDVWVLVGMWSSGLAMVVLRIMQDKLADFGSRTEWFAHATALLMGLVIWSTAFSHWYKAEAPCFVEAILWMGFIAWLASMLVPIISIVRSWVRLEDIYSVTTIMSRSFLAIMMTVGIRGMQEGYLTC